MLWDFIRPGKDGGQNLIFGGRRTVVLLFHQFDQLPVDTALNPSQLRAPGVPEGHAKLAEKLKDGDSGSGRRESRMVRSRQRYEQLGCRGVGNHPGLLPVGYHPAFKVGDSIHSGKELREVRRLEGAPPYRRT